MSWQVKIIDDLPVKIHNVFIVTSEDVDLFAAAPIWRWQSSEEGEWVIEHAYEKPIWHRQFDYESVGYKYAIQVKLKEPDYVVWALKWGTP